MTCCCISHPSEEEKAEIRRFAKNFLPILFNVYSTQPAPGESAPSRMAVLETIKVYLTITDQQVSSYSLLTITDQQVS